MECFSAISKEAGEKKSAAGAGRQPSFFKPVVQPKLTINQPNDVHEQEADAVADKVMRMPAGITGEHSFFKPAITPVQRKCKECEEEERRMQRKEISNEAAYSSSSESYINALSGGQALSKQDRDFFEPRMGYDFSNVRLHTDSAAVQSAKSINALAYTTGNNIVFNQGQYAPGTDSGKRLLGHELTHVVQQKNMSPKSAVQRQQSSATSCPLVVASSTYSRGNDDWAECSYETARITVELWLDQCSCAAFGTDMPLSVNYSAVLQGKSFTGLTIPNPSGTGTVREQEGQASHIATGRTTPGRSAVRTPTGAVASLPGMSLSEANLPPGTPANTSGPLVLTSDDARRGGIPGDPGDTVSQRLSLGGIPCQGGTKAGQVNLGGGFQVISYDISASSTGVLNASISLAETGRMAGRIPTPLIDITRAGVAPYPRFPGVPRPGGTGCTCNSVTGVQVGSRCNRGTGGAGFGKTP